MFRDRSFSLFLNSFVYDLYSPLWKFGSPQPAETAAVSRVVLPQSCTSVCHVLAFTYCGVIKEEQKKVGASRNLPFTKEEQKNLYVMYVFTTKQMQKKAGA